MARFHRPTEVARSPKTQPGDGVSLLHLRFISPISLHPSLTGVAVSQRRRWGRGYLRTDWCVSFGRVLCKAGSTWVTLETVQV